MSLSLFASMVMSGDKFVMVAFLWLQEFLFSLLQPHMYKWAYRIVVSNQVTVLLRSICTYITVSNYYVTVPYLTPPLALMAVLNVNGYLTKPRQCAAIAAYFVVTQLYFGTDRDADSWFYFGFSSGLINVLFERDAHKLEFWQTIYVMALLVSFQYLNSRLEQAAAP